MSRDTNLRDQAQRARRYSFAQNGRTTRGLMGDHVVRRGCGVETWKPSWKGTTTTLRIFPALCPENPAVWDPWRFSSNDGDYGDWIRTYPAVRNFGDPGVTMLMYDPTDQGYDPQGNPCWMLYNSIHRALDQGQGDVAWVPFTKGSTGRGAALSRPGDLTLVQGAAMQHNGKVFDVPKGFDPSSPSIVWQLASSAAGAMLEAMNEPVPEFRGDPTDFAGAYVFGDPVGITAGAYVNFYQLGHDPRERQQAPQVRRAGFGQAPPPRTGGGGDSDDTAKGYGCFLTRDCDGVPAGLSGVEDTIRRKWRAWDEILHFPTHEEQIRLLSGAFPASMILYAFGDTYRDMIPEDVFRRARGAVTVGPDGPPPAATLPASTQPRRGWGAPVDPPAGQPETRSSETRTADPVPPPTTQPGQRRGFGTPPPPTPGDRAVGETAPTAGIPDAAPPPPAATATPATAPADAAATTGASVLEEIRRSRERMNRRTRPVN